ncbi:lipopolysaccharide biosynthesis protein [Erythrobacter alti]|uniref:lipopolysaccharide biosynthesis protein n=1 Tax=Erythrobacter alti TaxID=1896145 RepID=UPI0030F37442
MTPLQNLRRNFGKVLTGTFLVSGLNLVALTLNTNALGLLMFGQLMVIQSVTELFSGIYSFNTWQSLSKFGSDDLEAGNLSRLRKRYHFALLLDLGAAILAALSGILVFLFFIETFGLDQSLVSLGIFYAISAGFQVRSASQGIFRLTERFEIPIMFNVAEAFVLAVNAAVLWWIDAPFAWYIYTIAIVHIITAVSVSICGLVLVNRLESAAGRSDAPDFSRREFLGFAVAVSANGTIGIMLRRGEVLIVSALLGPAAAGLFGVAFRGAFLLARFANAGKISIYPVLAKLVSAGNVAEARLTVWKASRPVAGIAVLIFLAMIPLGRPILEFVFGAEFGAAHPNLLWLMAGTLTNACLFGAIPLIELTIGASRTLIFACIAFVAFLLAAFVGMSNFGLIAAGVGSTAFFFTMAALVIWQIQRIRAANLTIAPSQDTI